MNRSEIFSLTLLAMLLPASLAMADWAPTEIEMATLPAYCAAKFDEGKHPESAKMWRSTMGRRNFVHIHHYCAGLNFVNRARGMTSANKDRQGTLEGALRNFDYVLTHAQPDFYLRPEILMNRGIALSMMNRTGEAVGDLLKSIEADPKQPRAYMTLADMYDKQKNRAKALETVTEGLRHNPDTKSLQRRYTELGGKLPYPEPLIVAPADSDVAGVKLDNSAAAGSTVAPARTVTPSEADAPSAPKIGSPENPYCRFCPD